MPTLLIGLGNDFRGDDGAGLEVARRVRTRGPVGIDVIELPGDPVALIEAWRGAADAVVVDAMQSGRPPGTIARIEVTDGHADGTLAMPARSSHGLGLAEAIALAHTLRQLPARLVVYGIEVATLEHGASLSEPVARAVSELVGRLAPPKV
jgi:hydrogenase maturation protease